MEFLLTHMEESDVPWGNPRRQGCRKGKMKKKKAVIKLSGR